MSGEIAKDKMIATVAKVISSHYPLHAKLDALRTVVSRSSEYLSFTSWICPDILAEMDKEERKSVRHFFGFNIPNAVLIAEMKLSSRGWRQELLHIAGLVRCLGSADARITTVALALTRDAEVLYSGDRDRDDLMSPRFFEWRGVLPRCDSTPTSAPLRYVHLLKTWDVGLWIEDGRLCVSVAGKILTNPHKILQILSKCAQLKYLDLLEKRVSTDIAKLRLNILAPEFAISWGLSGRLDKYRKQMTKFLGSNSTFSSTKKKIIMRLRLLLWPTAFAASVRSRGVVSSKCICGAVQTATHPLNLPSGAHGHSTELRALPNQRHKAAVDAVLAVMFPDDGVSSNGKLKLVVGEGMAGHVSTQALRTHILRARGERLLGSYPGDDSQHFKVDLAFVNEVGSHVTILDICYGSDDKLVLEDALIKGWPMMRTKGEPGTNSPSFWNGNLFKQDGGATAVGITRFGPQASTVTSFKHARYHKRYAGLRSVLLQAPGVKVVKVLPIAVGVGGLIPKFTRDHLSEILGTSGTTTLTDKLITLTQIYIVKGWRLFRSEAAREPTV